MRLDLDIDPASLPTAQQKGITRDGRVYTKAKVLRAKKRLVTALRDAVLGGRSDRCVAAFDGLPEDVRDCAPWSVAIEYVYSLRTTPKRSYGLPKPTRPDLDNLTKLVLDAMTESGCFFADDAQVVSLATLKRHAHVELEPAEPAHITVSVRPIYDHELALFGHHWRSDNESRD